MSEKITVEVTVAAPREKVWECFTEPEAVKVWNAASSDWHTPRAENDLRVGGRFTYRMEAKDGSFGFDFSGVYDEVEPNERITYTMDDDRKVTILFSTVAGGTLVEETFDPETENTIELQRSGWQAILEAFKQYVEEGL